MLNVSKEKMLKKPTISDIVRENRLAPLHVLSTIYGMFPIKLTSDLQFKLSYTQGAYGCIMLTTVSTLRIYLEPTDHNPTFFSTVHKIRNILLPVSCMAAMVFLGIHVKNFMKFFSETHKLSKYISVGHMNQMFWIQMIGIVGGYSLYIGENILAYVARPHSFVGMNIAIKGLEFFMDTAMLMVKLQYVIALFVLRNLLCRVIIDLQQAKHINVNFLANLYEKVLYLSECINRVYNVSLGIFALMTVLNCISSAYFYFTPAVSDAGYLQIFWIVTDLSLMWFVITSAVIFTREVRFSYFFTFYYLELNIIEKNCRPLFLLIHYKVLVIFQYRCMYVGKKEKIFFIGCE